MPGFAVLSATYNVDQIEVLRGSNALITGFGGGYGTLTKELHMHIMVELLILHKRKAAYTHLERLSSLRWLEKYRFGRQGTKN